jgi:hypothetical protein
MKNTLRISLAFITLVTSGFVSSAQTSRNVVVEHFTNTRCSICGRRNPGLKQNLNNDPSVFHISYHPSSPYSSCVLNQHNKSGNDDRTRFYGVYGATPRVAVQGSAQSVGVDFNSSNLYKNEQGKTTPVDIRLTTIKKGGDSLVVRIAIHTSEMHSLKDLNLYAVAVEDSVFYNAPNGEDLHLNVYRKTLFDGDFTLPSMKGDSVVFEVRTANDNDWNASRMYVMAFVQNKTTKFVEQVQSSKGDADISGGGNVGIDQLESNTMNLFPNPVQSSLTIDVVEGSDQQLIIRDLTGSIVYRNVINQQTTVDVSDWNSGLYVATLQSKESVVNRKFIKLN